MFERTELLPSANGSEVYEMSVEERKSGQDSIVLS
jgi:hypothetical protein